MTASTRPQTSTLRIGGLLWTIGPAWYVLCEAIAASAFHGYNYAIFYISDLGVPEFGELEGRTLASRLPQVMDAGFIGAGVLFLLGLVVLLASLRSGVPKALLAGFGILHAVGIVFVGLVPGSPQNVDSGLIIIHVLGAVAAIAGGNLAAISSTCALRQSGLSRSVRSLGMVLGIAGLLSAVLLTLHWVLPDGVWERGAVYSFMLWQLLIGITLRTGAGTARHGRPLRQTPSMSAKQ